MKKLPKKLVWTLGVILGLVLVVIVGLRLFFPAEKVREMAVDLASEKLGREVTVRSAGLSLAGGLGVRLTGVAVDNPEGMAGPALVTAEEIDLKLEIGPLLKRDFQVRRLVINDPRVSLVRMEDGRDNFTFENLAEAAPGEESPDSTPDPAADDLTVRFDRLEIHDGHLSYLDEGTDQGVTLAGLDWTGNLSNPAPGEFLSRGRIAVDSLLVVGDQPVPVLPAVVIYELSYDTPSGMLDLTRGDWEVGGIPVDVTGQMVMVPDSLRASGTARVTALALAELLEFLPPEQKVQLDPFTLAGSVDATVDFSFDQALAEPIAYSGLATVKDLAATSEEVAGKLVVSRAGLEFDSESLRMETEGATFAGQPLVMNLTVRDFEDPHLTGRLSGELDLAFVGPFLPPGKEIELAGRCALESTFEGRANDVENLAYDGRATFKGVSYADNVLPDTLRSLNGTVAFNPESVTVEKMEAVFGAGDLSVTGRMVNHLPYFLPAEKAKRADLPRPEFTFNAAARRIDIDRLFPAAAPGAAPTGGESVPVLPDSVATEALPDILATGTFRADTLIYSQVPFTAVSGKVRFEDRVLTCREVSARVYGGTAAGSVAIDLDDLNDPGYSGAFEAREIEADNFISRFVGRSGVVFGKTGLAGSFSAHGRDPERIRNSLTLDSEAALISGKVVTGEFMGSALTSLAAKAGREFEPEQGLKDLTTLIKVENGRVGLNDLKTRLGNLGDLTLGGSYGFDGGLEYKGSILLTKEQTASLYETGGLVGTVANLFGNRAERLRLPLTVGGTMTSPRMDIDYTELTDNLRSQVNDSLKDELNSKLKGLFGK